MDCSWPSAAAIDKLQENEVHVWCANLEPDAQQLGELEQILSDNEKKRAARFRFWRHRRRYIAGRGILRCLLGAYLGQLPADVSFSYSEYKKPFLTNTNIHFNLSHSKESALYAFCMAADIGIDIEKIRPINDADGIACRFFAPTEYARFVALPEDERNKAFFTCWTRKEAFIKAVGEGFSYPLGDFDVSFADEKPAKLNYVRGSGEAAQNWTLHSLSPLSGYAAALAVQGQGWKVIPHRFLT